jgi:hypothetical protein
MESARCDVPAEQVGSYVDELEDARSVIGVPRQIVNMDEAGFCSCPMNAKKKTIVSSKRCPTKAACREDSNLNHMSLVATINLSGHLTLFHR